MSIYNIDLYDNPSDNTVGVCGNSQSLASLKEKRKSLTEQDSSGVTPIFSKSNAIIRTIIRETALGLAPEDIASLHNLSVSQVTKIQRGTAFKRAVTEMADKIDEELIASQAEDPVRRYLKGKALPAVKTLAAIMEDEDTPDAVRVKSADSILNRAGYVAPQEQSITPVIMLSPQKIEAISSAPKEEILKQVPDMVDGNYILTFGN